MSAAPTQITWDDFQRVALHAGTVVRVEPFPEARKPAWKIWVDFGEYGIKKTSAQITDLYAPESLLGKQVLGVINFPPKQIAGFMSEFLLTGFHSEAGVVLASCERPVANGARLA
ncbi:tRNA-binding protein [Lysobacteraceae bacterium NML120232]|nr:tRNA-binding protein [Xanthomonadaceae bacterium NML120232]PJK11076.1 tRNA-binding protein [Xanthomonadaceae bacterium NML08-0793]